MTEPASPTSPADHHKIRVMLVDDRTVFLRSVSTFLQQVSQVELVGVVSGGEEAVLAQAQLLRAQIVILGLKPADPPGLPIIARLHVALPEIKVIVLTLLDLPPYRQAALAAGAAEFVSRVSAGLDLLPAIRRVAAMIEQSKRHPAPAPVAAKKKAIVKKAQPAAPG